MVSKPYINHVSLPIGPTSDERGLQFYVNRYLVGHPDDPRSPNELGTIIWLWHPGLQDIMSAIGLAGLANLTGNTEMKTVARAKYGAALRQTGKLINDPSTPYLQVTMRSIVMLALFEVTATPAPHIAFVVGGQLFC
jgi:hypothetical protein